MSRNGQAEYAYGIMKNITDKLFSDKLITEEEFRSLNELNKEECFSRFCTNQER